MDTNVNFSLRADAWRFFYCSSLYWTQVVSNSFPVKHLFSVHKIMFVSCNKQRIMDLTLWINLSKWNGNLARIWFSFSQVPQQLKLGEKLSSLGILRTELDNFDNKYVAWKKKIIALMFLPFIPYAFPKDKALWHR